MKKYLPTLFAALCVCSLTATSATPQALSSKTRITKGRVETVSSPLKSPMRSAENPTTEFTATEANFCPAGTFSSGVGSYWLMLSSAGLNKSLPTHEGQMARIFIMAEPPADDNAPVLPTGKFPISTSGDVVSGYVDAASSDFLDVFPNPDDPSSGLVAYSWTPGGGYVEISDAGNGQYTINAVWDNCAAGEDDTETVTCKASFTGEVPYVDYYAYTPLGGDRNVNVTGISGRYEGGGSYNIAMYNVPLDGDGFITGGGDLIGLQFFTNATEHLDFDEICQTYTAYDVMQYGPKSGCYMQGAWYQLFGSLWLSVGTYLSVYDESDLSAPALTGLATGGTITISKAATEGEYTIDINFTTPENNTVTAKWTGDLPSVMVDSTDGVEGIEADGITVRGGIGSIEAPAGAEIFNLSGIQTGSDNLPAGVYVVRYNGKTTKVIVK